MKPPITLLLSRLSCRRTALWVALWCCLQGSAVVQRRAAAAFLHPDVNPPRSPPPHRHPRDGIRRCWGDAMTTTTAVHRRIDDCCLARPSGFAARLTALGATKKKTGASGNNKTKTSSSTSGRGVASSASLLTGFGGAAVQSCSCGSALAYNKCCGKIHRDVKAYAAARPSDVVRARYTAYANRVVDFIVASTHPLNPSIANGDVEHWKRTIEANCYDNFLLHSCVILDEKVEELELDDDGLEKATVKFEAQMTHRETGEHTAFVETSTFLRDPTTGAWLYREGIITSPDNSKNEVAVAAANAADADLTS